MLAELAKLLELQLGKDARVAWIVQIRIAAPQVGDDLLNVGQFLGALDAGVRREDLLAGKMAMPRTQPVVNQGVGSL